MATEDMGNKEPMNIVILGGSFAGLSVAHNFLKKTIHEIGKTRTAPRYKIILVSPSTHLYWNIGAPRAIVAPELLPHDRVFIDILQAFEDYPSSKFHFVHGAAFSVDFTQRIVAVAPCTAPTATERNSKIVTSPRWSHASKATASSSGRESLQSIPFHALVIATGTSAESPLLSLHGPHEYTISALKNFRLALQDASSIVIAGAGPSGVECAGQLATYFNSARNQKKYGAQDEKTNPSKFNTMKFNLCAHLPMFMRPKAKRTIGVQRTPKNITLVSGADRLLPRLPIDVAEKAELQLRKLGVNIMHDVRVVAAQELLSNATRCTLSNDMALNTDLYIAATGVKPNTDFLPAELLDASGYVTSDPHYLRLERAGDRVYAIGDCAAYSKNTILDVYDSIPVVMHNLRNDLWEYEFRRQNPYGGAEEKIAGLVDAEFVQNPKISQLVPITRYGGVGILMDMKLPSFMVWVMKGRDYRVGKAKAVAKQGHNPYAGP